MTPLTTAFYVILTSLALLSAQFTSVNRYKEALSTVTAIQLRNVLNGFAVYTVNNWNNLILTLPDPIAFTNPVTLASVNVVDVKSPTADELMLLNYLPAVTPSSLSYTKPLFANTYKTAMSISPPSCLGNACNIDLYVYFSTPVANTNGQFDNHLITTSINTTSMSMGYSYPADTRSVVGFNKAWTFQLPQSTEPGIAMIHTNMGTSFFNQNFHCIENGCWKSPVQSLSDLPLLKNSLGDIRLVISLGSAYSWTGSFWNALNSNSLNSAFAGQSAGNTGSNNVYVGSNSGNHFYVAN